MTEHEALHAEDAASLRAAEQARRRKERREAKIRAGGSDRLNRITGLGGGIQRDVPEAPPAAPASATPEISNKAHADPDEVDISQHYYQPQQGLRPSASQIPAPGGPMSQDDLTKLMLGLDRSTPSPFPRSGAPQDDPFAAMMAQMMAGAGAGGPGGMPNPFAQSPFPEQQQAAPSAASSIWRILHALFALSLGLYVALSTPFRGTKEERDFVVNSTSTSDSLSSPDPAPYANNFFWVFASVEAILLTTRFFVDGAGYAPGGIVGMVLGFLPGKTAGYIKVLLRYGQIFSTVRSDLLVCVFVLGVASLWRGYNS